MSLDVTILNKDKEFVFEANITHNLGGMADKAGIYEALWRPYRLRAEYKQTDDYTAEMEFENNCIIYAKEIIPIIEKGLSDMVARPKYYKQFNAPNGWGTYDVFIGWIAEYLEALKENPDGVIEVSR